MHVAVAPKGGRLGGGVECACTYKQSQLQALGPSAGWRLENEGGRLEYRESEA
jgi:hypothetical protein